ncbi:MAG: sugar phosphate isomerase, partial [Kiritimatiellia bacterium]
LESIWRRFFVTCRAAHPALYGKIKDCEDRVFSIMTGGDYALVRSVESFEDYASFGRRQADEMKIAAGDMLVAITEGGETSSVLGTVDEAAGRGAKVFLLFNNPADILRKHIERSRRAIEDPRVTVLDLYCGPMAIAGSTRMQATTSEQLVAGAALELILAKIMKERLSGAEQMQAGLKPLDFAAEFKVLLDALSAAKNIATLGRLIAFEAGLYKREGLVTYFADRFLLDIFTDTTERAPTFMLPPFRKRDDTKSPPSWAFVKNPCYSTPGTWTHTMARRPRCLEWTPETYRQLGAADKITANPPALSLKELLKFTIGNEPDPARISRSPNAAVMVVSGTETAGNGFSAFRDSFDKTAAGFDLKRSLVIGASGFKSDFHINLPLPSSPLRLMEHMAVKLVLNTLSTATMIVMGRVAGNWMSWVEVSNKKLRDRGIRLISELCGLSYRDACHALHETLVELEQTDFTGKARPSPVQYTIKKLGRK